MQKTIKSVISAVMALMMVISLVPASLFAVSASATVDPKKIDKVVVDMRSAEAFGELAHIYEHTPTASEPDPFTGGKYSFSDTMKAMRVEYNGNQKAGNTFRVMPAFNESKTVTMDYKYWVIVYAAKTTKPYSLTLFNSPRFGAQVTVTANGKDTGGKFVISEPFDISTADANGRSILSRWTGLTQNNINFVSEDVNAEFYIKEMSFFKSAEDAKAYYSAIDLEKSPSEYEAAPSAPPASTGGNGLTDIKYIKVEESTEGVNPDAPTVEEKRYTPVIIDFTNEETFSKTAKFSDFEGDEEGLYEFVTLPDGTGALKLKRSPFGGFNYYRMMPALKPLAGMSSHHKYMRITFMSEDIIPHSLQMRNNKNSTVFDVFTDTTLSKGEFIRSNAIDISAGDTAHRLTNGIHCTFGFNSELDDGKYYIKEIAFFSNKDQAYEYYGDSYVEYEENIDYTELKFGIGQPGTVNADAADWGKSEATEEGLEITYLEKTNFTGVHYMAKVKSNVRELTDESQRYIRVLYSADHPDGLEKASMLIRCDKGGDTILLSDNVVDTNGEFVLTEPAYMTELMAERFMNTIHNSLIVNAANDGGKYTVKAIYFFNTRADAEKFKLGSENRMITVNGNDITKYQIVVDKEAPVNVYAAAEAMADSIELVTGAKLPVVTDEAPASKYEILVGLSNRELTYKYYDEDKAADVRTYRIFIDGDTVVITSVLGLCTVTAADTANVALFYKGRNNIPENIALDSSVTVTAVDSQYIIPEFWTSDILVEDPTVFTEDFDTDDGYFNEDHGQKNWKYENGVYKTNATDFASSYLHVYETNVNYKAKLSYTSEKDGTMGIMARVNSEDAYVKAGYDFAKGVWYIEVRAGGDHFLMRPAEVKATVAANTAYELELSVISGKASLKVNGKDVITDADVSCHVSPGRLGVYAQNASVSVDDIEITLLSGQGTVFKNVYHTKFFTEAYLEGGSVFEMNDGSWIYQHHSGRAYVSTDNGYTWTEREKWTDCTSGYVNILRLNNGDWLKIARGNTHIYSQTSSDDGKTWVDGGTITTRTWNGNTTAGAGNMNDKIMQFASGRIFYSQNYESAKEPVNGRYVFCEYFWSDDNGKTWTKSDTASWEIEGNEDQAYFGENKFVECSDGTVRMYASWHPYGNIVYSDSTDGGKTFGPLQFMTNMYTPHSSMQFVRDTTADNDYTYYMVWCNMPIQDQVTNRHTPRSRLSLAKTTDGKNWVYLGDVWRWESRPMIGSTIINHVVDPFIKVTEDYIICGSGFSDSRHTPGDGGASAHQGQRQHIFTIRKDTLPEGKVLNVFKDVPLGSDYYEAVTYVTEKGLFNGTSATTFAPDTTMNRSMFVTVLGRLDGADVSKYTTPTFSDVKAGQWYTSYVEWAAANGIVNGLGNGVYGINGEITVEQACTILARYNGSKTAANADGKKLSDFVDADKVSGWAKDSVTWAVENGIYKGHGDTLAPVSAASRALVATMFANYVKVFG